MGCERQGASRRPDVAQGSDTRGRLSLWPAASTLPLTSFDPRQPEDLGVTQL